MVDSKEAQLFFVGSVITSLVAAILMIATDFGGYCTQYYCAYIFAGATIPGGIIIFIISLFFICFTISIIALIKSDLLPDFVYLLGFYISIAILILTIIGAGVFGIEMLDLDPANWWFDASFYGALIGSILTSLFFLLALLKMKLSFIPKF